MNLNQRIKNGLVDLLACVLLFAAFFNPRSFGGELNLFEISNQLGVIHALFRGDRIFQDTYLLFGPLSYYLPYWIMRLGGEELFVLQAATLVGWVSNYALVYLIARLLMTDRKLALMTLCLILVVTYPGQIAKFWGGFRYTFLLLAVYLSLFYQVKPSAMVAMVCGAAIGLSGLASHDQGLVAALTCVGSFTLGAFITPQSNYARRAIMYQLLGLVLIGSAFLAVLFGAGLLSAFASDLSDWHFKTFWVQRIATTQQLILFFLLPTLGLISSCSLLFEFKSPMQRSQRIMAITVMLATLFTTMHAMRAPSGPQVWIPQSLAIVCTVWRLSVSQSGFVVLKPLSAIFVLLAFVESLLLIKDVAGFGSGLAARMDVERSSSMRELNLARAGPLLLPMDQADEIEQVTRKIIRLSSTDDVVFGYPDLAIFNFLADRPFLNRFTIPELAAANRVWASELEDTIHLNPPKIIVLGKHPSPLSFSLNRDEFLIPAIPPYVRAHFARVLETKNFEMYILLTK